MQCSAVIVIVAAAETAARTSSASDIKPQRASVCVHVAYISVVLTACAHVMRVCMYARVLCAGQEAEARCTGMCVSHLTEEWWC
jgi:hypothetical protein